MNRLKIDKSLVRNVLIVAGLAVGLGMATAKAASSDKSEPQAHSDGVGAMVTDTAITAKVKSKLMGDKRLDKSDINVTTTNGVVTLEGSVSSAQAKSLAAAETKSIDGVKSVDNNLRTPGSSNAGAKTKRVMSDSWITTKVKSELLADSVSKGFKVNVETKHGVVILTGTLVNQDAINHVKNIAGKVEGVKDVDTTALVVVNK